VSGVDFDLCFPCVLQRQVNSETDFATKTDQFRDMVGVVAAAALRAHANGAR
jgi:translation elongation factor EF-Ts